ncbi:alginate lyase family protein [Spirosoma harenae]
MTSIGLIWRTIRHLTFRQMIYQVIYRLRGRAKLTLPKGKSIAYFLAVPDTDKLVSWQEGNQFTFLQQSVHFSTRIDWNYNHFGKLWTYHINYFDFLNQPGMQAETGLNLIHDFINQVSSIRDGLEAYPTSLRITNWVYFLSRYQIQDDKINHYLATQSNWLSRRFEYHLSGNHLLENGFGLLTSALYFRKQNWLRKAIRLIRPELTIQILADGGHYELSPVYHQILLDRLLNTIQILQTNDWVSDPNLVAFLVEKAVLMLAWLDGITFRNGDVPMVNDATLNMAPSTIQLKRKAEALLDRQTQKSRPLTANGYRMFRQNRFEFVADVGSVGPDHQPGHAHADTLSFVLYVDNHPFIVDNGVSTYQTGIRRAWERSTAAHNTVTIDDINSSEVWASFRVGRRARVTMLSDTKTRLMARHDGYRKIGILHERGWICEQNRLVIQDRLLNALTKIESSQSGTARFYFHPTIRLELMTDFVEAGSVRIRLVSVTRPKRVIKTYELAEGFNVLKPAQCLEVTFTGSLETTFLFTQ